MNKDLYTQPTNYIVEFDEVTDRYILSFPNPDGSMFQLKFPAHELMKFLSTVFECISKKEEFFALNRRRG